MICQKCHSDNVIAVVKSAGSPLPYVGPGANYVVPPISEAIHRAHRETSEGGPIAFSDAIGRSGGCQGCHPAHRSDGVMDNYPIGLDGNNGQALTDNRLAQGGCFVGRDVHSNPLKDVDGAETPAHLNAAGQWLADNVFYNQAGEGGVAGNDTRGIWCTNCHSQLGQELWRNENCADLINGDCVTNPRGAATLADMATAVGVSEAQAIAWLDPTSTDLHGTGLGDFTHAIWDADPGLCDYVSKAVGLIPGGVTSNIDANVATVEVVIGPPGGASCVNGVPAVDVDCGPVNGGARFQICGTTDADGDFNVALAANTEPDAGPFGGGFCTTPDCVASAQAVLDGAGGNPCTLADGDNCAVPVPFSAATDARDHWLASGEPHCADCHAAPYTEQSGNITPYPPFNYPRKASLNRYTRGHQDLSCQGCHESIHGLYPVTPAIDNTSYAQAAALNYDGTHGPLKCGTCHTVNGDGIPDWIKPAGVVGSGIANFDDAVTWAHTYTAEANVLNTTCQNCHGVNGFGGPGYNPNSVPGDWTLVVDNPSPKDEAYLGHANDGRTSRLMMDNAEMLVNGGPFTTTNGSDGVCIGCHVDQTAGGTSLACNVGWKQHLTQGRVAESVWEKVSLAITGTRCGW